MPFHDGNSDADVFWGASVHWNTYLGQYVMLLNRAENENFGSEGIYFLCADLVRSAAWTTPRELIDGEWYPQVVGLEEGSGTNKLAGHILILHDGPVEPTIIFSR